MRTTPIPLPEAKHSIKKGLEKFGRAKPGVEQRAYFNASQAKIAWSDHTKASFFNKSVRGLANFPKSLIKRLYYPTNPRNPLSCLIVLSKGQVTMATILDGSVDTPLAVMNCPKCSTLLVAKKHFGSLRYKLLSLMV